MILPVLGELQCREGRNLGTYFWKWTSNFNMVDNYIKIKKM